eukprot:CAMPEP_0114286432 /NCGR_PEP_ID=MMETSP0059-20121206/5750_1 /TAXON_ID=36894 /ORGANISM="Pyramimonas parkeae, Strain CCMP726" /LENGTH=539 /DNA_ID=CAMNT_0001407463 /DNA_START=268 /DNA_END=1887 /DNA_ORIENTATION=-
MATAAERKTLSMGTLPIVSTNTSLSPRAVYVSRHPFRNGLITRVNLPLHFLCATEAISAKETEPRDELENDTHAPLHGQAPADLHMPWYHRTWRLHGASQRGPQLGLGFLMVQAVMFVMNLCSQHPLPLPTSALWHSVLRWAAVPPRAAYNAFRWLRGRQQKQAQDGCTLNCAMATLRGVPARLKRRRAAKREHNVTRALERKTEGFAADHDFDSVAAIKLFKEAARLNPMDPEPILMLSKCLSDRVFEKDIFGTRQAKRLAAQAVRISKKTVRRHPDLCLAHVAHGTNLGRLAMFSENRERVKIAGNVREEALRALEIEPENDLAIHILGRWELEMASLGPLTRSLAKMLYGDLGQGCMHRAAKLFQDAAEKNPERLIHRVCLAKCHLKNGQKESAKKELLLAMKLQVDDVNAKCERQDGEEMLKKHWNITAPPPPPLVKKKQPSVDLSCLSLDKISELAAPAVHQIPVISQVALRRLSNTASSLSHTACTLSHTASNFSHSITAAASSSSLYQSCASLSHYAGDTLITAGAAAGTVA